MKKMLAVVLAFVVAVVFLSPIGFSQVAPTKEQIEKDAIEKIRQEIQLNFCGGQSGNISVRFEEKTGTSDKFYEFSVPSRVSLDYTKREFWAFLPFDASRSGNLIKYPKREVPELVLREVPARSACGAVEKTIAYNKLIVKLHKQAEATLSRPLFNFLPADLAKKGKWTPVSEKEFNEYVQKRQDWWVEYLTAHPNEVTGGQQVAQNK